jgi:hypothetical protein
MSCTAQELTQALSAFWGGSEKRFQHPGNRAFIISEGLDTLAKVAHAYWLLDLLAFEVAPVYAREWLAQRASTGIVTLTVQQEGPSRHALLVLSLEDDAPPAFQRKIDKTDFPIGSWNIYFGTDEISDGKYVTTGIIPQEY